MREIIIKRINVVSVMKPLFLLAGSVGAIVGLFMTIFLFPRRTTSVVDVDGVVVSTSTPISGGLGTIGSVTILMMVNCLV